MASNTPIQRAPLTSESSFLHCLASIHMESSRNNGRSRRHSTKDDGSSSNLMAGPRRRATVSGDSSHAADQVNRPVTPPCSKETEVPSILRTHDYLKDAPATPSQNRVSFCHNPDGTINHQVTSFLAGATSSKGSLTPPKLSNTKRDLSTLLSHGLVGLPFSTVPSSPDTVARPPLKQSMASSRPSLTQSMRPSLPPPPLPAHPKVRRVDLSVSLPLSESRSFKRANTLPVEPTQAARKGAFPPPPPPRRNSMCVEGTNARQGRQQVGCSRVDYILGDVARSPSHMVIVSDPQAATEKASQLKNYDFAFIKRTDGSWTYAILAHRSNTEEEGECMMFVMNPEGSTKMIKKKQWAEFVRCVAVDQPLREVVPQDIFVDGDEEDCSMVTFTSSHHF